jgi:uncharacterized repeat protein (TIGR01451 family)
MELRRPIKRHNEAIATIILALLLALTIIGEVKGSWRDQVLIEGEAKMACWKACVRIRKTLEGAFTNASTGEDLTEPTNLIAIAADFPTKFRLIICAVNCRETTLTDVVVTDTIKNNVAPVSWTASKGTVTWDPPVANLTKFHFNELTWNIGTLEPGDMECLEILIQTLPNPSEKTKYETTSGDEGDGQDIEMNEGATVTAISPFDGLTATTEGIRIIITDNGIEGDGIGVIESPELPYSTPWAEDSYQ